MKILPSISQTSGGYHFLINNRPFIMLAAETHNSAATSREYMQNVWKKAKELHCNTILVPVYWELSEPQENQFDFSLAEQLIADARAQQLKLVLLWFGSWKNGLSTYAPQWVKKDTKRFPRVENEQGAKTRILSMFHSEILSVELNAFTHFMSFLKELDAKEQTVIVVQVENEIGVLGATRDFSVNASKEYQENVPDRLLKWLKNTESSVLHDRAKQAEKSTDKAWGAIFGAYADEAFMCWHYASYVEQLAKAGKECYGLPMFTNTWLSEYKDEKPGAYPCGGPVPKMLDVWKCAAPSLDVLSPDIYTIQFENIAGLYMRSDNPLLIAETRRDKWMVANLYTAIGMYHALCYSPFGAESIGEDKSFITQIIHTNAADKNVSSETVKEYLSQSYRLLGNMMPILATCYGTDKMIGFTQNEGRMTEKFKFGRYQIQVEFYHQTDDELAFMPGAGIVIQNGENELTFIGYGYSASLETDRTGRQLDFLSLEKGTYDEQGNWVKRMDLNGDEQYIRMEENPTALKMRLYEF